VAAVREHDTAEIRCGLCGINVSAEALLHQFRYQAAVINMGVGKKKTLYFLRVKGEILKVTPAQGLPALEHSAVNKDFLLPCLQKKT
jgi:hypothetical protein